MIFPSGSRTRGGIGVRSVLIESMFLTVLSTNVGQYSHVRIKAGHYQRREHHQTPSTLEHICYTSSPLLDTPILILTSPPNNFYTSLDNMCRRRQCVVAQYTSHAVH